MRSGKDLTVATLKDVIRPGTTRGLDFVVLEEHACMEEEKESSKPVAEEEVEVTVDDKYYGRCPRCGHSFNYDYRDVGKLVRCRYCSLPMRLKGLEANG